MKKLLVFRLIAVLFGLGAGLVLFAAIQYARGRFANRPKPYIKPSQQAAEHVYHPGPFYFPFHTRPTYLLFTTEPFTEDSRFNAKQNSEGFRTREYTIAHPPKTFRILIIGDSFTWGHGVTMEEAFPYVTEELLRAKCDGFQFEVIALGVNGNRLADNYIKLLAHGQSLKPDLVIIQVTTNDLDFYDYQGILSFQGAPEVFTAYADKEVEVMSGNSLDWKVFVECLDEIKKWSQSNSVPVSFLAFPLLNVKEKSRNFNHYDPKVLSEYPQLVYFQRVVREIRKHGFPTHYLLETFREKAGDHYLAVSENDGHPNAYAHRLAAEALVSFLFQEKLVDCSGFKPPPAGPNWNEEKILRQQAEENWGEYNTSYTKQLSFFEQLQALYPQDPWISMELANVYMGLRRFDEAFRRYAMLPYQAPGVAAPWYHMAQCTSDTRDRVGLFEKMLQVVPDHTASMKELASYYLAENRKASGCKLLLRVTQIPQYVEQYAESKQLYQKNNCDQLLGQP